MNNRRIAREVACVLMVVLLASTAFAMQVALPSPTDDAMAHASREQQQDARQSEHRGDKG